MKYLTFEEIKAQLRLDDEQAELERTRLEGEPQYTDTEGKTTVPAGSPAGKHRKREADDPRKPGNTNVRLKA